MTRAEHPSRRRSLLAESTTQCNDAIVVDDEACDAGNDNPIDGCERRAESREPRVSARCSVRPLQTELVRLSKTGLVDELDLLAMARNKVGIEAAIAEKRASSPGAGKIDVAAVRRPTNLTGAQLHTPASNGSAGDRLIFREDAHPVPARPDAYVRARRLRGLCSG